MRHACQTRQKKKTSTCLSNRTEKDVWRSTNLRLLKHVHEIAGTVVVAHNVLGDTVVEDGSGVVGISTGLVLGTRDLGKIRRISERVPYYCNKPLNYI